MRRVVLASASPRRRELMGLIFPDFKVVVSHADENITMPIAPEIIAAELAARKAHAAAKLAGDALVVGADTIVVVDGKILGKPTDEADAVRMISMLSGRAHTVITGVCFVEGSKEKKFFESTEVVFDELLLSEIEAYVATGDPMDKAGAYGIQNGAAKFVSAINGCYFNVMGLPVRRIYRELKTF